MTSDIPDTPGGGAPDGAVSEDPLSEIHEQHAPFRGSQQTTFRGLISDGIFSKNPVFVLALSLCPAVAVTNTLMTSLAMGLAVLFVISANNLCTSLLSRWIHPRVRVPAYILIIATLVTLCELVMSAFFPEVYRELGVYLKLIVVFAIILARAEVFASKNPPLPAFMDGLGMGLGFLVAMVLAGTIREIAGSGELWGVPLFGPDYPRIIMLVLAPGGFIVIGLLIGFFRAVGAARDRWQRRTQVGGPGLEVSHG